jgi:hypothetical protein
MPAHTPANTARTRSLARSLGACVLVVIGMTLGVGACAKSPKAVVPASPGARGEAPGIEVAWWLVDDVPAGPRTPGTRDVLASLSARTPPVDWRTLELWRANGLRVLAVPQGELPAVRGALGVTGPAQSQWLGEIATWTDVARAPEGTRTLALALDNGPLSLRNGRLALALRCWFAPDRPVDAARPGPTAGVLELELVPRFTPDRPRTDTLRLLQPDDAPQAPIVFDRLRLASTLRGGESLLILAEAPWVEWTTPRADSADTAEPQGARTLGPPTPGAPTLGEALLGVAPSEASGRRTRLVMVLTPSVPGVFRVLTDAR